MSDKTAATWHGVQCDGRCCRQLKHLGVCSHSHACAYHLREEANQ